MRKRVYTSSLLPKLPHLLDILHMYLFVFLPSSSTALISANLSVYGSMFSLSFKCAVQYKGQIPILHAGDMPIQLLIKFKLNGPKYH